MIWLLFSQISAVSISFQDIFAKSVTKRFSSPLIASWAWPTFALLILIPFTIFKGIPEDINSTFWIVLIIRVIFDLIGLVLYGISVKVSDISLVVPIYTFSPVFALLASLIILKERVNMLQILGIIIIVVGAFLLAQSKSKTKGIKTFLKSALKEKGMLFMLGTAFFFGSNSVLHKISLENLVDTDSPTKVVFSITLGYILLSSLLFPFVILKSKSEIKLFFDTKILIRVILVGILGGVTIFFSITAVNLTNPAFPTATQRMAIVYSSILGFLFFKEKLKERLIPILVMVFGLLLFILA